VIYNGLGTVAGARISGRVLEDKGAGPAKSGESRWRKLRRTLGELESDEIADAQLELSVLGKTHAVRADKEGLFTLDLKGPLAAGAHEVGAKLISPARAASVEAGRLLVYAKKPGVAVLSDIDDTVLQTGVTNKAKMLKRVLLSNAHDLKTYAGAPALYLVWAKRGYPIVFVSGSPINLYSRLREFFSLRGFPTAAVLLKNLGVSKGSDSLFDQKEYKLRRIKEVRGLLPGYRLLMVGDTGEKDPEIYSAARVASPRGVTEILIHRVTKEEPTSARFRGQTVFDDYRELARALHKRKALSAAELKTVSAEDGEAAAP
jgi:phosphatidate phosphatase APP1